MQSKRSYLIRLGVLILIAVASLLPLAAQKQLHHVELIDNHEGLNDLTINDLCTDQQGILWIGTENGLYRYINGQVEFYHENSNPFQLNGHCVTSLYCDSRNRIWVGDRLQGITIIDQQNTSCTYLKNDGDSARFEGKEILKFKESGGSMWVLVYSHSMLKVSMDLKQINQYWTKLSPRFFELKQIEDFCLTDSSTLILTHDQGVQSLSRNQSEFKPVPALNKLISTFGYNGFIIRSDPQTLLIKTGDSVTSFNTETSESKVVARGVWAARKTSYSRSDNGDIVLLQLPYIWVFSNTGELKSHFQIVIPSELHHLTLSQKKIELNKDGLLFIGTDHGILKVDIERKDFHVLQMSQIDERIGISGNYLRVVNRMKNGHIFCSYVGADAVNVLVPSQDPTKYEPDTIFSYPINKKTERGAKFRINGFCELGKDYFLISSYVGLFEKKPGAKEFTHYSNLNQLELSKSIWCMHPVSQNIILAGTRQHGLQFYDVVDRKFHVPEVKIEGQGRWSQLNSVWSFYTDSRQRIWILTAQGLFRISQLNERSLTLIPIPALKDYSVWAITETSNQEIWLGTIEHGIYCLNQQGKLIKVLDFNAGLNSMSICSMHADDSSRVWVSTPIGLTILDANTKKVIQSYSSHEDLGVMGFNYRAVASDLQGRLYFGSKEGLLVFHSGLARTKKGQSKSSLILRKVNGVDQWSNAFFRDKIELDHGIRSIDLEPALIDYNSPNRNRYRYKLVGVDEKWNEISSAAPRMVYANLDPGNYTLEIEAYNSKGIAAANTLSIPLEVIPQVWETWWFRIGFGLIGLLLMVLVLRLAFQRSKIENELIESQLVSMRSQMNPHFFFNALNSIQDFIFHNDRENASNYLSSFAKLLRNILDNSTKRYLSLDEEILFLTKYLEMESLRFDNQFEFDISLEGDINVHEQKVPSMLIQPIAENSVKHGLASKSDSRKLYIRFFTLEGSLYCVIEDNGVGRSANHHPEHHSRGLSIVEKRIELLSKRSGNKLSLRIEDLKNKDGKATGTRVSLKLN